MKKIKKLLSTRRRRIFALIVLLIFITPFVLRGLLLTKEVSADSLFKFDEGYGTTINDSSGSVNGTITGASWQPGNLCNSGKCLYFDGSSWISFGDESTYDFESSDAFTIQFWFRHGTASAAETIIQKYEGTGNDGGYRIRMESDGTISFGVDDANGGFADDNITSTSEYDDNRWHHVSAVKNGTTGIYLYIDSVLVASDESIGSTGTLENDDTFYVGDSDGTDNGDEFVGFLDELKIYTSTARTAEEIKSDLAGAAPDRGIAVEFAVNQFFLSDGLIGYWTMDESSDNSCSGGTNDSCDLSGNGIDGAWQGNATSANGKFGKAVTFDGTGDYIKLTNSATLSPGTNDFTISTWVNLDDKSTTRNIYVDGGSGDNIIGLQYSSGDDAFRVFVNDLDDNSNSVVGSTSPSTNTWYHVAAIKKDNTLSLFVNGLFENSNTNDSTGSIDTNDSNPPVIGAIEDGSSLFWDGEIDDTRIYNRALTPDEIVMLYNWAPDPVGYWPLDEGTGTAVNDISTKGNSAIFPDPNSYVKSVEYVEITIGQNETSASTNLSLNQTITNSVPFVTSYQESSLTTVQDDDWQRLLVDVYFESSPNRITAERTYAHHTNNSGAINIGIYVVEFDPVKVSVQQGVLSFTGTSDTDTITAVDQSKAAMVFYYRADDPTSGCEATNVCNDDWSETSVAGWFSDDDTLSWQRDSSVTNIDGHYYVFEALNDEFSVQANSFNLTGVTSNTANLGSNVDTSKTFVIGSYRTNVGNDDSNSGSISIYLDSASAVGASRYATDDGNITDIRTFAVEFSGNETVQRGTFGFVATDQQKTAEITEVDLDYAIAWNPNTKIGNMSCDATNSADIPDCFQKLTLTDSTTIQGDREAVTPSRDANGRWEVIEFPAKGTGTASHPSWTSGKFGSGLVFDGVDDYVCSDTNGDGKCDANTNLHISGDLSISLWIKPTTIVEDKTIVGVSKNGETQADNTLYSLSWNDSTGDILYTHESGTGTNEDLVFETNITSGNWYHIFLIRDTVNKSVSLYLNGVLVSTETYTNNPDGGQNAIFVIGNQEGTSNNFNGIIDDVKIYNYVRTPQQLIEDMNAGHPPPGSPIGSAVAYWKFDEGYGTTAHDSNPENSGAKDLTLSAETDAWTNEGKFGKAFSAGGARWLTRADDDDLDFTANEDFTISIWLVSSIASGGNPAATEYIINKPPSGSTNGGYAIYANTSGQICLGIDDDNTSFPEDEVCSSSDVYDNNWHHITAVKTGTSSLKMYVDGLENGTADTSISSTTNTLENSSTLFVGSADAVDDTDDFNGNLDEIQIFRSALNSSQVMTLFNRSFSQVFGATSTDSSGNATNSALNEYCPPGLGSACTGPIAHWRLDENKGTTVNDISGNKLHGELTSAPSTARWVKGKKGSALKFNGVDQAEEFVTVSDSVSGIADFGASDSFSISLWVKGNTLSERQMLVHNSSPGYLIQIGGSTNNGYAFFQIRDGTFTPSVNSGSTSIGDDNWHHVVAIRNVTDDKLYIYVDGILRGTDDDTTTGSLDNSEDLFIGGNLAFPSQAVVDDVKIFDYALTQTQVAWDFNRGAPYAWWKLDDNVSGRSKTINDSSGFGFNGTTDDGANNTGMDCTVEGKRNLGCDFDGVDDYIDLGTGLGFTSSFSAAGWIYLDENDITSPCDDAIINKNGGSGARDYSLLNECGAWLFRVSPNGTNVVNRYASVTPQVGVWTHLTGVYDSVAQTLDIYINGIKSNGILGGTVPTSINATNNSTDLGRRASDSSYLDGKLDDVRLYNYPLTKQQILQIVNEGAVRFGPTEGNP